MNKLLHKLMLDCNEATRLVSIKRYGKLTLVQRIRLSLHLAVCKVCNQFSLFNDLVDESMPHICSTGHETDDKLSEERKGKIATHIESILNNKK